MVLGFQWKRFLIELKFMNLIPTCGSHPASATALSVPFKVHLRVRKTIMPLSRVEQMFHGSLSISLAERHLLQCDYVGSMKRGSRGPIYPPVLAGGRGQQNLGNAIVNGDFNCDGKPDMAVAAETATPFSTDRHYSSIGSVIVYYSWQPPSYIDSLGATVTPPVELKTNVVPSANAIFPNPLLITYPVTQDLALFGHRLAVGNFNGDCYFNDSTTPTKDSCNNLYNVKSTVLDISKIKIL